MSLHFESAYCSGEVQVEQGNDRRTLVKGRVEEYVKGNKIFYLAAAPPDYRASFSGSGLPFYSQIQAFDQTPNKGVAELEDNEFIIEIMMPNAYYVGLGTVYVPPTLYLEYYNNEGTKRNVSIKLSDGIPYRSLTWPGPGQNTSSRANPTFYATQFGLSVRSQEQILRDSAYPTVNHMEEDFWGLKPPL